MNGTKISVAINDEVVSEHTILLDDIPKEVYDKCIAKIHKDVKFIITNVVNGYLKSK